MELELGLALGSNLGDRLANLRSALEKIGQFCDLSQLEASSVFETEPVGCPAGSDSFFNAVVVVDCNLAPMEILEKCQEIESDLGRPEERDLNAPRTIDIDILYFGETVFSDEKLTIPHPRIAERRFVLVPLSEIRPDLVLPGQNRSIDEILAILETEECGPVRVFSGEEWRNTR